MSLWLLCSSLQLQKENLKKVEALETSAQESSEVADATHKAEAALIVQCLLDANVHPNHESLTHVITDGEDR